MSESRAETIALPAACAERVATRVKKVVVVRSTSQALLHHVQWIVKRSGVIASNPRRCSPKSQQESCEMDKGAHYYSCDLQVHSPLDGRWKGKGNGSEAEREAYAASLVAACRSRGLHAIALTDHHEMTFVPYVRRAAADERRPGGDQLAPHERLVVFPGMELTLGVPCQALLLFDSDFPQDLFSLAANALAIPPAGGQGIARLDHIQSLAKLKDELDKHSYLRDRYIILPNVSDGQFSLLRKGQAGKYVEMPCVGGYVDGPFEKLGDGNKNILAGKAQEYGYRCIAAIQTSDNRTAVHARFSRLIARSHHPDSCASRLPVKK